MGQQTILSLSSNFNGGEVSPRMFGRPDTAVYPVALAAMENFAPSLEGPAVKVPGFRYITAAAASSAWLSTFVFSRTQGYVLEWLSDGDGAGTLRFFTNGGRIETAPGVPYEVDVPYTPAEAPFVGWQQSHDRLYLAHRAHALADLTRTSATTFTYAELGLENGPFADQNKDKTITVAFTSTEGSVTGYASGGAVWTAGHVGELFRVETRDYAEIPQWEADRDVAVGQLRAAEGRVYAKIGGAARTGTVIPTHNEGAAWDGDGAGKDSNDKGPFGVQWLLVHDRFGIVRIDTVTDAFTVTGTVLKRLPNSAALASTYDGGGIGYTPPYTGGGGDYPRYTIEIVDGEPVYTPTDPDGDFAPPDGTTGYTFPGTWRWAHAAISNAAGWPVAVVLAWGRLVLFTDFEVIATVIGDYGGGRANFAEYADNGEATEDMSFRRLLTISNPVLWAREDNGNILIGTLDGVYLVGPINGSAAVSAENIQCVKQSRYGCSAVQPIEVGSETIYAQAAGKKLRAAEYSFQSNRYQPALINVWSRHILGPGCIQLSYEGESEEMVWALRGDGVLAMHPRVPEQEVKGFARRIHAAGPILSAVAIPSEDGTLDEQWVLVTDSDTGAKSIERRDPWWVDGSAKETAFFVDSGVTVTAPASATLTGLTWLAGRDVAVLSDGAVLRGLSVTGGGSLTLPRRPDVVTVGLGYAATFATLKPELRDPRGHTMQGVKQKIYKIALRVLETLGVRVAAIGARAGEEEEMMRRGVEVPMGEGAGFFSGDVGPREIGGNWGRDGQYQVISDDPVPCIVTAAMPRFAVTE